MKKLRTVLAALLALCLAASFFPAAFALPPDYKVTDDTKTVTGDVTDTNQNPLASVKASANDAQLTVNGNVSDTEGTGQIRALYLEAGSSHTATAVVDKNVLAESSGQAVGIGSKSNDKGSTDVTVNGDVTANSTQDAACGVNAVNQGGGGAGMEIGGNVTAQAAGQARGLYLQGDDGRYLGEHSTLTGTVGGNVSASGSKAYGVDATIIADDGIEAYLNLTIDGNVEATGSSGLSCGLKLAGSAESSGTSRATVSVGGDVSCTSTSGEGYGIRLEGNGQKNVLVEGTVSGSTAAVYVQPGPVALTLWKAELNGDGEVIKGSSASTQLETMEENILYIIKMDEGLKQQLTLGNTAKSHGFDCAKENSVVTLTGANLDGLSAEGVTLQQEGDGSYSLIVPKGGGVYLHLPVRLVAAVPVVEETIIEVLKSGEGVGLRLLKDGTYVLRLADGQKFFGTYEIVDGVPVFTLADGSVVTPEPDGNGHYVFTLPYGEGEAATFTMSPTKLERLVAAMG